MDPHPAGPRRIPHGSKEAIFARQLDDARFFSARLFLTAHIETTGWGSTVFRDGQMVRVLTRQLGTRRFANYSVPASGLEHMSELDWPAWLEANQLVQFCEPARLAARCYWDAPHRQHTWEVSTLIQDSDEVTATCLVPTEAYLALMAWRGPGRGEPVTYPNVTIEVTDIVRTNVGAIEWESYGDELVAQLVFHLLHLRYDEAEEVWLDASAPSSGALELTIQSDGIDDHCTPAIRQMVARLYEWTEHCQGMAWTRLSLDIKTVDSNIEFELELGYD